MATSIHKKSTEQKEKMRARAQEHTLAKYYPPFRHAFVWPEQHSERPQQPLFDQPLV